MKEEQLEALSSPPVEDYQNYCCDRCALYTPVVMTFKGEFLCQRCTEKWLWEDRDVQRPVTERKTDHLKRSVIF